MFVLTLWRVSYIGLPSPLSFLFPHLFLSPLIWYFVPPFYVVYSPYPVPGLSHLSLCVLYSFSLSLSFSPAVGSDLKDIQNNKHRYLIASENQRPGHFSTAPIGSLTASPSSGSLCSQVGLQSVTSIQERIMSTPGGEEAIERLKVQLASVNCNSLTIAICPWTHMCAVWENRIVFTCFMQSVFKWEFLQHLCFFFCVCANDRSDLVLLVRY